MRPGGPSGARRARRAGASASGTMLVVLSGNRPGPQPVRRPYSPVGATPGYPRVGRPASEPSGGRASRCGPDGRGERAPNPRPARRGGRGRSRRRLLQDPERRPRGRRGLPRPVLLGQPRRRGGRAAVPPGAGHPGQAPAVEDRPGRTCGRRGLPSSAPGSCRRVARTASSSLLWSARSSSRSRSAASSQLRATSSLPAGSRAGFGHGSRTASRAAWPSHEQVGEGVPSRLVVVVHGVSLIPRPDTRRPGRGRPGGAPSPQRCDGPSVASRPLLLAPRRWCVVLPCPASCPRPPAPRDGR